MRPKSIATVVVCFDGVCARSSTPSDSLVTSASVRRGTISDTEPTRVVLPTPKPPATTILVEAAEREALERTESTEGPFNEVESFVVGRLLGQGGADAHVTLLHQVTQEDADHADGHRELRR